MATELLDGEHRPGVNHLNSCTGVESPLPKSELDSLPRIQSVVAAEAMTAETMTAETMIGAAVAEAGQWGGSETILLVEDEAFVRKVTAEVLESAGYRLVIARGAAEAREAYRRGSDPVDLLLADVVMPGMSGRELAAEFTNSRPRARVLLMSGYSEQLALCDVSPHGRQYLAKPFSMRLLLRRVREVLDTNPLDFGAQA
jgi:two-component system, cell cycle sensor histidine kinase and response regulator CckA